ncbi:MAG TPA: formylglycine-generating enzyme family protein, partial [Deltaproteobacteria bacterium]|nr:formylglycine-generating enzyme family protein [Deltaproteobacteria bacterium]
MKRLLKTSSTVLLVVITIMMALSGCERKPEDMVYVPEGEFTMGSNLGEEDEKPERKLYLKGCYIDKHEVTNAEYRKFVKETG